MVNTGWKYWQILDLRTGQPLWAAISRPDARARIDRIKVWTLLPDKEIFVANWFVTQDHQRDVADRQWEHDGITGWDFCDVATTVPLPSADDLNRLIRPEAVLTLDQIDRIALVKIVGKREAARIATERARRA